MLSPLRLVRRRRKALTVYWPRMSLKTKIKKKTNLKSILRSDEEEKIEEEVQIITPPTIVQVQNAVL